VVVVGPLTTTTTQRRKDTITMANLDQLADEYCQKAAEQAAARRQRRSAEPPPATPPPDLAGEVESWRLVLDTQCHGQKPADPLNRQFIAWLLALIPTEQLALLSAAVDNQVDEIAGRRSPNESPEAETFRWMVNRFGGALDGELADRAAKAGYAF
jgi:hypothetical protein